MTEQQERETFEAWWDAGFSKILPATYGKSEGWSAWQARAAHVPETDCGNSELIEAARRALEALNRALPFVESKADELETLHDENDESETYEGYRCACDIACATTDAIAALKDALR